MKTIGPQLGYEEFSFVFVFLKELTSLDSVSTSPFVLFSFGPNFSYSYHIKDVCDRAFREHIIVFYNDTVSIEPV